MAKTHVRCQHCGLKPIDHVSAFCAAPEYKRISDAIVHPSETVADIANIDPSHWKHQFS